MISADDAIALASRRQRRAVRRAADFAASLGEPVGFVRRAVPGGTVFEAIALDSARACAVVDERGTLCLAPPAPAREPWSSAGLDDADGETAEPRPAMQRFGASARRAAEDALVSAARPRGG
jgi:hypothetical protein